MWITLRYISYLAVISTFFLLAFFLCVEKQYWFHPEATLTFAKVDDTKIADLDIIGMVLQGKDIDPNGARFRPMSHAVEVLDAKLRMPLAHLFGPNPTFNSFSILLFVFFSVIFIYKIFSKWIKDPWLTTALTLLSMCSIAYLSNVILLFRPAKRMALFFAIILLYILNNFIENPSYKKLTAAYAAIWGLLLSDEEGIFLTTLFIPLFLVPFVTQNGLRKNVRTISIWLIANVFALCFIGLKTIGASNPSFNDTTLNVSLLHETLKFLNADLATNTALLTKTLYTGAFGFAQPLWPNIALVLVMLASMLFIYKKYAIYKKNKNTAYALMFVTASLICFLYFPIFNALLQQIGGSTVMRSVSYYYGSSTFIGQMLILLALLALKKVFFNESKFSAHSNALITLIACIMIPYNLSTFRDANQLVEALHYAPRYSYQLNTVLENNWHHHDLNVSSLTEIPLVVMSRAQEAAYLSNNVFGNAIAPQTYTMLYNINKFGATGTVTPQFALETLVKKMNFAQKSPNHSF